MSPEMRQICAARTPEDQRQFDVDALTRILATRGVLRRSLERCPGCDAYRVRTEACLMCGVVGERNKDVRTRIPSVEELELDAMAGRGL
jgi:hypothetical protein